MESFEGKNFNEEKAERKKREFKEKKAQKAIAGHNEEMDSSELQEPKKKKERQKSETGGIRKGRSKVEAFKKRHGIE